MAETKTKPTEVDVPTFLEAVPDPKRKADAIALDALFRKVTGFTPKMWGPSIVGYGRYDYTYATGHSGSSCATGFSPRKANMVVYILPGYSDHGALLARLGKHKIGKSCLYLNRLDQVDMDVLAELIRAGLDDLATYWPVLPG